MRKLFLICSCVLLLVACSKETGSEASKAPVEKVEEPTRMYSEFTGEEVEAISDKRPLFVTINNEVPARPQAGLGQADFIYETLIEGGVTRLGAIFQQQYPDQVGPIRSARDYFVHLAKGYDAFYIAHGYSPGAKELLERGTVDYINGMQYDGTLFKRSKERKAPHNSYINQEAIDQAFEKTGATPTFSKKPPFLFNQMKTNDRLGEEAPSFVVKQGAAPNFVSDYEYDGNKGVYYRTVNGTVTIDALTEEPVALATIVVLAAPHTSIDAKDRQAIQLTENGLAMVFTQGQVYEAKWENKEGVPVILQLDGTVFSFTPGVTWTHIVPTAKELPEYVTYQLLN